MTTASIAIPADVTISNPHQYVAYLNDPSVAALRGGSPDGRTLVVSADESCVSFNLGGRLLTINSSNFFGAYVFHKDHGPNKFPSLVADFGKDRADGGYCLLIGPLEAENWYRILQQYLEPVLPGGVAWRIP